MTDAKQKPRKLTEQEFYWLYLEGKPVNQSYAATTIHKDRLIELMDMKANYDKLLVRIEKLETSLKYLRDEMRDMPIHILTFVEQTIDEAKNE